MNTPLKVFRILAILPILISGCAMASSQAGVDEPAAPRAAVYESILGKPLTDRVVADFVAANHCSRADQSLLCNATGMALWTDSHEVVETVYLYLHNTAGFEPYKGELPFGLKFYDNMLAVEYKLDRQGIGDAGLPDKFAVPDHMHYQATYHQVGMTIIYNYPSADEDATIYAILVSKQNATAKARP